ncbi:Rz1-like lysis system protein LysC [Aggregatibacter actinomycetemcomitans]|uniref:Rz1-like lysis system protein LysC n=1 Tax=Aggregatibacter actinomycetemcomitans TaxID=714 RepID=UPI0027DAC01A|nr:hypothetical protein [Aggregatibacter actinomycetemcomitans]
MATSLTACSSQNKLTEKVKVVRVSIPDELLRPCPKPALSGDGAADIAVYAVKVTDQLKICNNRINQIKAFVEQNDVGSNLIGVGRGEGSETSDDTDSVEVDVDG